jgi:apolipoprotein D and lipocalin family protein
MRQAAIRNLLGFTVMMSLMGCSSQPPVRTVDYVDLQRFMGDWYVIANIPTFIEKGAHNAVESYSMKDDGIIETTFSFRKNGYEGEEKIYRPTGYVVDKQSNAIWGMQFIWPVKADYRIMYLKPDYSLTVIGRNKRDYVWVMARTPTIDEEDYQQVIKLIKNQGYDIGQIQRVPQKWN